MRPTQTARSDGSRPGSGMTEAAAVLLERDRQCA